VGDTKIIGYTITSENLEESIAIEVSSPAFTISVDSLNFGTTATLPQTGGTVYIRFAPTANGPYTDSIFHVNPEISKILNVSGQGYDPASNIISIASARSKSTGTKVTIAGRITVADQLGNPAYVQDATGGIPVFDFVLSHSVQIGDSVIVTGPIGVFNDQKQISGSGIFFTKIDTESRVIEPRPITISELAANEGFLVTVQGVTLVNDDFVFYPQSTERITNGTAQADLRIDGDTDIPGLLKPQGTVDITGVVGRFRANAQLLPRFQADIPGTQEPSTPADTIPASYTFDVVNWNFEFFGATREEYGEEFGPEDEALQLQNIKTVLDTLNADIIAVQEVSDDSLLAILVAQLGNHSFLCSDRYSYSFDSTSSDFPPQKLCFIYDTTTVEILAARPLFESLYDSARLIDPSLLPNYPGGEPSSFYSSGRLPYLITANITINDVTERISFINIHAKSGSASNDRARRAYDATVLKDSLDTYFANEQFIIIGDLNDDLDRSINAGATSPYQAFVDDTLNYLPVSKALSDAGARTTVSFQDVIDHQILSDELGEEYITGSIQVVTPFRLVDNYANTTSDHLPVRSRYTFQTPEIYFTTSDIVLSEDSASTDIEIHFSKPLTTDKKIIIATTGSAANGSDFTTTPLSSNDEIVLEVSANSTFASFTITTVDDQLDELDEQAVLTLQPVPGLKIGTPDTFTLTIIDNDIPSISFVERYESASEGSGPVAVKLKLSTAVAIEQTVSIQSFKMPWVIYDQDYTTDPATAGNTFDLMIPAGSDETEFNVTALADRKRELPLEVVTFYLKESSSGLQISSPSYFLFAIIDVKPSVSFDAYPNPTAGRISLRAEGVDPSSIIHAEIRNNWGERIFSKSTTLDDLNEKLSQLLYLHRKGVYTLTLSTGAERHIIKIVKE
jgi:endonuclease/exonuclease/phosphatase family metal-dependent hydrolase